MAGYRSFTVAVGPAKRHKWSRGRTRSSAVCGLVSGARAILTCRRDVHRAGFDQHISSRWVAEDAQLAVARLRGRHGIRGRPHFLLPEPAVRDPFSDIPTPG